MSGFGAVRVAFDPDMAAYPNSNQRALMSTIEASRLLILPTRGNLCLTIQQLKACPGLVSGGFEGGARLKQIGLFEMRRLEPLSNTIFGVAITLLAYDLPKASSRERAGLNGSCGCLRTTCHCADDQFYRG